MGLRTFANLRLFVSRYYSVCYASSFSLRIFPRMNNFYEEEAGLIRGKNGMIELSPRPMLLPGGEAIRRYSARSKEQAPGPCTTTMTARAMSSRRYSIAWHCWSPNQYINKPYFKCTVTI